MQFRLVFSSILSLLTDQIYFDFHSVCEQTVKKQNMCSPHSLLFW